MKKYFLAATFLSLVGCATISPQAANVMVHTQVSSLLDDCERLGNVSVNASAWSKWDKKQTRQQAENDVREQAYARYGADTVAIVNTDEYLTSATVQGIAFKCN